MNTKNIPLSTVGTELGLGTSLPQQVQDLLSEEELRKKLLGMGAQSNVARDLGLSPIGMSSWGLPGGRLF
jgi:hypothetical protein